jgi:hypothetical protein
VNREQLIEEHLAKRVQGANPSQGSTILTIKGDRKMSRTEEGAINSGTRLGTKDFPLFIQLNLIGIYLLIY